MLHHTTPDPPDDSDTCDCQEVLHTTHAFVLRALEVAGKRLVTKDRRQRGDYQHVPPHLRHVRPDAPGLPPGIPAGVPVREEDLDRLLKGVWDLFVIAVPDRPDIVAIADTYVRQLLVAGEAHQLTYLQEAFSRAGVSGSLQVAH